MSKQDTKGAPERVAVTDEELAEVERLDREATPGLCAAARTLLPRLAAELRALRARDCSCNECDGSGWTRFEKNAAEEVEPCVHCEGSGCARVACIERRHERHEIWRALAALTFCGQAYTPGTPDSNDERLTAHVKARADDAWTAMAEGALAAQATNERLRGVLRSVEWSGVPDGGDPDNAPGGCPSCGASEPGPHAPHCGLGKALARTPAAQEPASLAAALTAAEDALLVAGGWVPDTRGFYVDMAGDERMSGGVSWPRSTAIEMARERARTP